MTTLDITLLYECENWENRLPDIRTQAYNALKLLCGQEDIPAKAVEIAIVLADDAFIQDLNRRYRGKDRPTNVLSFAEFTQKDQIAVAARLHDAVHIGDLVFAYETVATEAIQQGKALKDHFLHLLLHGGLHLLGYDHEADSEAEIMEKKEIMLLEKLGIANPYENR